MHKITWIDTHCHLEMLDKDAESVLRVNEEEGVTHCVTIGTNHESNQKVKDYCHLFQQIFGTLGFHPHDAKNVQREQLDWIREETQKNKKIIGIGECGFDLYYNHSEEDKQKEVFAQQLELADELGVPLVIHSREAEKQTRDLLDSSEFKGLSGVFHCFTSTKEFARYVLDKGFYVSFNGICTFPKSKTIREVLSYVPLERIILETDAPFLTPVPFRGRQNRPGYVALVGNYIADYLGISRDEFSQKVRRNTQTLFQRMVYEG
ncbi:MAG: TatD family hydrolase [Deltaproteobacteria bacterium]|nr:TatD family hydrolase [Deltaproteobacteria bacterium]